MLSVAHFSLGEAQMAARLERMTGLWRRNGIERVVIGCGKRHRVVADDAERTLH